MDTALLPPFSASDAPTADRMHWVQVSFEVVLGLYNEQILRVQRNHLRRAREAKHILGTDNPLHANFLAARTPDGKVRLIDGYTRITAVVHEGKVPPTTVWLGIVDCDNVGEADLMYDAVDSKAAVKRGRDAFEEGLRRAHLLGKLNSPAFARAQVVSAVVCASGEREVRKAVYAMRKGLQNLDPLGITAGRSGLPAGALAALLLAANNETDKVPLLQEFAAVLRNPDEVPASRRKALEPAFRCAEVLKSRRESNALSGKNVEPIMEMVLGYWKQQKHGGRAAPLTRTAYLESLEEQATAEVE